MRCLKWPYAIDPSNQGFFWPNSPKRKEYFDVKRTSPTDAEATYQCNPGVLQGEVFIDDDFRSRYQAPEGLEQGKVSPHVKAFVNQGECVVQAWDTAFSATDKSDYSVCITALLVGCDRYLKPNQDPTILGPCDSFFRVFILDVFRERLNFASVVREMRSQFLKWEPQTVVVEKKAYGAPAIEQLESTGMPLEPVTPVEGKRARALEGVGAGSVQGWFRNWRVSLPADAEDAQWLPSYLKEMKGFTGEKGKKDDQVDATVHLVQHAIRRGSAGARLPTEFMEAARDPKNHSSFPGTNEEVSCWPQHMQGLLSVSGLQAAKALSPFETDMVNLMQGIFPRRGF